MPAYLDITGQRFGRLVALRDAGRKRNSNKRSTVVWLCRCDCGKEVITTGVLLRAGETKSCGCLKRINSGRRTHGMSSYGTTRTPEYVTWGMMRKRCNNKNDARYNDYGGRGITVCERWNSFENFLADMGPRPKGFSIERVNVDGNYEPSNCKWIPWRDQSKNRRHKTHCKKGHELSPENTTISYDGKYSHRRCKACYAVGRKARQHLRRRVAGDTAG